MKQGKLQLGDEAVAVQYELQPSGQRVITGKLILGATPPEPGLAQALTKMTGANLITDTGHTLYVEFKNNRNNHTIEFSCIPPKGFVL